MTTTNATVGQDQSLEQLVGQVADEFLRRQSQGERPDPEEYAQRHPHAADLLRNVLASLQLVALPAAGEDSPAADADGAAVGTLGDYRIVREVGRGGMGVVYEAEQISLGRRVALKVLPFAATMDPRQLQRFKNEARAAASLDHPYIVKVHAVGCDRGVHYFAMQFIDGQTLEALLRQFRAAERAGQAAPISIKSTVDLPGPIPADAQGGAPTPLAPAPAAETRAQATTQAAPVDRAHYRRVAEWGIQAAEALEHAHQLGIVHRDVKPGNLMLDAQGRLWVTDFGLARTAADSGLTMTGDLLGTLRYMSPEQALAKRVVLDHRTDVYSLGATLYELLTLQPVFAGSDRQELLRQIAFEEPRPPRKVNRAIPADLETIALKALEKNPADRYATAEELAADLRRFLEDQPIRARRPALAERARKWARRHLAAVAVTLVLLTLAVIGLATSTLLIWREQELTDQERIKAVRNEQYANQQQAHAKQQQTLAEKNAANTLAEKKRAEEHLKQALRLVRNHVDVIKRGTFNANRVEEMLRDALTVLEAVAVDHLDDAEHNRKVCQAYRELAETSQQLGRLQQAEDAFRRLLPRQERQVKEADVKGSPKQKINDGFMNRIFLAIDHQDLGDLLWATGRLEEAEAKFRQSLAIFQVAKGYKSFAVVYGPAMADLQFTLAAFLAEEGRIEEAQAHFQEGLKLDVSGSGANARFEWVWFLANAPKPEARDPKRALEIVEGIRKKQGNFDSLEPITVAARYRMGDWKAVDLKRQFPDLLPDPTSKNGAATFFQAMTWWKLGEQKYAQQRLKRALDWMEKFRPGDPELVRLWGECLEMGLSDGRAKKEGNTPGHTKK